MLIHCTACKATFEFTHPAISTPERLGRVAITCKKCGVRLTMPRSPVTVMVPDDIQPEFRPIKSGNVIPFKRQP